MRLPKPRRIISSGDSFDLRPSHAGDKLLEQLWPVSVSRKLIPLIILNALEGKPLPVYGDGQNVRDWLYVEDHCRALFTVLARART